MEPVYSEANDDPEVKASIQRATGLSRSSSWVATRLSAAGRKRINH
jgi:hypothetical protein